MLVSEITDKQYRDFNVIERTCSAFSLIGCVFIITTFMLSKSFRKPITRLVFYASFGNMMTNVATLMARTYIEAPSSPGCQFQAFLIQMFLPADAFWTLAMAFNVYLTFYQKYDAQKLKRMEIPYLAICYGAPFVVALTYVFISTPSQGRMYGNALLWCWVSQGWDIWRIATFYGPVWVAIFIIFFIYIRTGRQIYRKYRQLRSLNSASREPEPMLITEPFSTKTTEVYVTSEIVSTIHGPDVSLPGHRASAAVGVPPTAAYSVTITSDARRPPTPIDDHDADIHDDDDDDGDEIKPTKSRLNTEVKPPSTPASPQSSIAPTLPSLAILGNTGTRSVARATSSKVRRNRRKLAVYEANNAAWSYAKCALLFFTALLITWIPSTANRVYSVVNQNQVSLGLEYASAFVLPLQGFWNGLIYIFTTRKACKKLLGGIDQHELSWKFLTKTTNVRGKEVVQSKSNDKSTSSPDTVERMSAERNSFMMGFIPSNGKQVGLGITEEAWKRT